MDDFPTTLKAYLKRVINNTRDLVSEQLSLADMFVLSDFLFQKWLCYGFKYCLVFLKENETVFQAD